MPADQGDARTKPRSRFLRHLLQPAHRHRDWTVNEPARRTNRRGDSPRGSPRERILLLSDWASRIDGEKRESLYRLNGAYSGSGFHGLQAVSFLACSFFSFLPFLPSFLRGDFSEPTVVSRSFRRHILRVRSDMPGAVENNRRQRKRGGETNVFAFRWRIR